MSLSEKTRGNDLALLRRVWPFIRPHRRSMIGAVTLLPIASLLHLLPPYLLKRGIDEAIVPGNLAALWPIVALLIGSLAAEQAVQFGQAVLLSVAGQRAMHDLRRATHSHLLSLRLAVFDGTPIGRLMTRVTNDVESIAEAFSAGLIAVIGDVFTLAGIVVAMLLLDWKLALLTFAVLPFLLVVVLIFQRVLRRTYRSLRKRLALINGTLQEQISGIKVIQIFGQEARAEDEFAEVNRAYRNGYHQAIRYDAMLFAFVETLGAVTVAGILWYIGGGVIKGIATFGLLVAFVDYVQKFFVPIRDMSAKYAVMQQALAAAERVFSLLDQDDLDGADSQAPAAENSSHPSTASAPSATASPPPELGTPHVRFERVAFSYGSGPQILSGVDFELASGQTLAIVGPTGAGKSTIARILTRLYPITSGNILLSGVNIRQIPIGHLRRRVVTLGQEPVVFKGTVESNIRLQTPTITGATIHEAAERTGVLRRFSLAQPVESGGTNLSRGERQLIVFARALAHDPEVLVLDEATANVDPETEQLVQAGVDTLMQGRTAIVIAHRLTTIEHADEILVLQAGEVRQLGPHATLLQQEGLYRQLHTLQFAPRSAKCL